MSLQFSRGEYISFAHVRIHKIALKTRVCIKIQPTKSNFHILPRCWSWCRCDTMGLAFAGKWTRFYRRAQNVKCVFAQAQLWLPIFASHASHSHHPPPITTTTMPSDNVEHCVCVEYNSSKSFKCTTIITRKYSSLVAHHKTNEERRNRTRGERAKNIWGTNNLLFSMMLPPAAATAAATAIRRYHAIRRCVDIRLTFCFACVSE